MTWLIGVLFMVLPLAYISFGIVHAGHKFFFVLSVLLALAYKIENRYVKAMLIYLFSWQLFLFIQEVYFSKGPDTMQYARRYSMCIFAIAGAVFYYVISTTRIDKNKLYDCICLSALLQGVFCVFQYFHTDIAFLIISNLTNAARAIEDPNNDLILGTLGNPNFVSAYIAFSLPFFYRKGRKIGILLLAPLLLLPHTTVAAVSAILGLAAFFRKRKQVLIFVLLCMVYAFYVDGYAAEKVQEGIIFDQRARIPQWIGAVKAIDWGIVNVTLGVGPGIHNWASSAPIHNEWLTLFLSFGLVGVALFIGFITEIDISDEILFSAFIIFLVNMFGSYPLHLAPSGFLFIIIIGLMENGRLSNIRKLTRPSKVGSKNA